jgi:hypothetical protein
MDAYLVTHFLSVRVLVSSFLLGISQLVLPFIFYGFGAEADRLAEAAVLLLEWIQFLRKDGYFASDVAAMHHAAVRYAGNGSECWNLLTVSRRRYIEHEKINFPDQKRNIPKVHYLTHYRHHIPYLGHPSFWQCRPEENMHIRAVKDPVASMRYSHKGDVMIRVQVHFILFSPFHAQLCVGGHRYVCAKLEVEQRGTTNR